jgi:4-hydroxy-3-polyprenylbenzoate decarboxylase
LPPERRDRGDFTMSRMLIDACKPFPWRDRFPISNKFSAEKRKQEAARWSHA